MFRFFILLLICAFVDCQLRSIGDERGYKFTIKTAWNGEVVPELEQVQINLKNDENSNDLILVIDAPFYNDPAPDGDPSEPFIGLWDYEVVQTFFLNDKNQYLEVEIGPHGQHLILLLNGKRNTIRHSLPLKVLTSIEGRRWIGEAIIPGEYFPPQVTKFNAYASHGIESDRKHLALYPADGTTAEPDIHNLQLFQSLNMKSISNLLPEEGKKYSSIWELATEGIFKYQITRQWNGFQTNIPPTIVTLQGFQDGVEVNYTMPSTIQFYPPHSFVIALENDEGEAIKIQLFADGSHLVDFLVGREEKINVENPPLDYRMDTKTPGVISGSALVPPEYFPPTANLMNAYVLFGTERMLAMSLNPVNIDLEEAVPDINSLLHFSTIDFNMLVNSNIEYSDVWKKLLNMPLTTEQVHHTAPVVIEFSINEHEQKTGRKDLSDDLEETKVTELKIAATAAAKPTEHQFKNVDGDKPATDTGNAAAFSESSSTGDDIKQANEESETISEEYETTEGSTGGDTLKSHDLEGTENVYEFEATTDAPGEEKDSEMTQELFGSRPFRYLLNRREKTPERDEHQRRFEESDSDNNELPITFEITIKSIDKTSDSGQSVEVDEFPEKIKELTSHVDGQLLNVRPLVLEEVVTAGPTISIDAEVNVETSTTLQNFEDPKLMPTTLSPAVTEILLFPEMEDVNEKVESIDIPETDDTLSAEQNSAFSKIAQGPKIPEKPEESLFPDITEIPDDQVISILKDLGLSFDSNRQEFKPQQIIPSVPKDSEIVQPQLDTSSQFKDDSFVHPHPQDSRVPGDTMATQSQPPLPDIQKTSHKAQDSSIEEHTSKKMSTPSTTEVSVPKDKPDEIPVEISEAIETIDFPLDILPPPHPLCFSEGLVPDEIRCQVFYECVIENGRWEVYRWRCKRGFFYDPETIACVPGFC